MLTVDMHLISSFLFILLGNVRVITMTVPDPCRSQVAQVKIIVADMCTDESATEEAAGGSKRVDSVVLRVVTQQEGCYCYVTVQNHTGTSYPLYMRKYNLYSNSAPEVNNCGLAIDIDYPNPTGVTKYGQSIECTSGTDHRSLHLVKDGKLEFRSRIISGNFTRGYCMQIFRVHSEKDTAKVKITCKNPTTISSTSPLVHSTTAQRKPVDDTTTKGPTNHLVHTTTSKHDSQMIDITTAEPASTYEQTTEQTTIQQKSKGTFDTDKVTEQTTLQSSEENAGNKNESDSKLYIVIGASSGGGIVLIIIVTLILCTRKRTSAHHNKSDLQRNTLESDTNEEFYDGLKNNVLYVSADEHIRLDGHNYYSEVEQEHSHLFKDDNTKDPTYNYISNEEISNRSKQASSESNLECVNGASIQSGKVNNVDKTNKQVNEKEEMTNRSDGTYAVVDKRYKRASLDT